MDENLKKLEMETDAELASIFRELSTDVLPSILVQTKLAVRHELNEQWFADRASTSIPLSVFAQTKSAIRNELNQREGVHPVTRTTAGFGSTSFGSILAIAAMILLCLGLAQYAAHFEKVSTGSIDLAAASLDIFVEAGDAVPQEDMLATIASDLDVVEQHLEQWPAESSDWESDEMETDPVDNPSDTTS